MQLRMIFHTVALAFALMFVSHAAMAQYQLTRLDSNQVGKAKFTDPLSVNAWGLVHAPGSPWWVADNSSGWSKLYKGDGTEVQQLKVLIPTAGENGPGAPTGVVWNGSHEFQVKQEGGQPAPAAFLFAALDGSITGWSSKVNFNAAVLAPLTNAPKGASFTGLAITNSTSGNRLYAADIANGQVDMFDGTLTFIGPFTDASLPSGFVPFGVRDINGIVYVAFANANGGPGGFVEQFKEDGTPVSPGKPLIHGDPLNQPWGIAVAPAQGFGPFSNTILISNNTDSGTINAFDPITGNFVGTLRHNDGRKIVIDQLWGIDFGDGKGANGAPTQLFYTAGPKNNFAGEFGVIVFNPKDDD